MGTMRTGDDELTKARFAGAMPEADRVTLHGSILRYMGIDELLQLWNIVVEGDMQLVGMRPMLREEVDKLPPDIREFYTGHKPGLFSGNLAMGRANGDLQFHLQLLREYIRIARYLEDLEDEGRQVLRQVILFHLMIFSCINRISDPVHINIIRSKMRDALAAFIKKS